MDAFVNDLNAGDKTDLDVILDLMMLSHELIDDPVAALRAVAEIVRRNSGPDLGLGFAFSESKFYYQNHADFEKNVTVFDDSGFGDLSDRVDANQMGHFAGIAYIGAYLGRRANDHDKFNPIDWLTWGNEAGNWQNSIEQSHVDYDLGVIAYRMGMALEIGQHPGVAATYTLEEIQNYNYDEVHPWYAFWQNPAYPLGGIRSWALSQP